MESSSIPGQKDRVDVLKTRSIWYTIGRILFGALSLLGILGFSIATGRYLAMHLQIPRYLVAFTSGVSLYSLAWFLYLRPRGDFWKTVEHEITHAVFALLFLQRVRSIHIERDGDSHIRVDNVRQNWFVGLVPYLFSPLLFMALLIKLSFPVAYQSLPNVFLGAALMFHLIGVIRQFHRLQPDIRSNGMLFSILVVVCFNLIWIGVCLASLRGEWQNVFDYLMVGSESSWQVFLDVTSVIWKPIDSLIKRFS